jgi:hypothetical protein
MPDGTDKKWDNVAKPHLAVKSVRFDIPLAGEMSNNPDERTPQQNMMPATRGQIDQFAELVFKRQSQMVSNLRRILWVLVVIAALLLAMHEKML